VIWALFIVLVRVSPYAGGMWLVDHGHHEGLALMALAFSVEFGLCLRQVDEFREGEHP
jgi:hypothetical protein